MKLSGLYTTKLRYCRNGNHALIKTISTIKLDRKNVYPISLKYIIMGVYLLQGKIANIVT
jgi:hypothetical protein